MIFYVCKYTPLELFAGFGEKCALLDETPDNFDTADRAAHPNLCGFGKSVIQTALSGQAEELVLVNCCDAMRRVCDIVRDSGKCRFLYLLDLPHAGGCCEKERFARSLMRLKEAYAAYSGKEFDRGAFLSSFARPEEASGPYAAVLGVRTGRELEERIRAALPFPVRNLTCTGNRNVFPEAIPSDAAEEDLFQMYAAALMAQMPCRRMEEHAERDALYRDPNLRGIVFHSLKFCDFCGMEYAEQKDGAAVPVLKLETDYTRQSSGQIVTRLEAFRETLEGLYGARQDSPASKEGKKRYAAGIDSGSASTDVVVLDRERKIVAAKIVPTGGGASVSAEEAFAGALADAGIRREDVGDVVTTGYGRNAIDGAGGAVTEITCHAKGAFFLDPSVRTIIDIGGQDSKVIRIDENGAVKNFVMNDKCAAGTGRFLEMTARALGLTLEEMCSLGLGWKENVTISSMCTVFAESEVVSLVAQNKALPDIIHGLCVSVAGKTAALAGRLPKEGAYMMTGGVAKNQGVVRALEEKLGEPLIVSPRAQLCGALGAALFALEK